MYLLDTNHCSRLLQGHPSVTQRLSLLGDATVTTCVIVQGELVFMAQKSRARAANLQQVREMLSQMHVHSVDHETANIYGKLKTDILDRFGPKEKSKRSGIRTERLGFAENDIWIAAVALRHGLVLVSADSDFDRIKQVSNLMVEKWWSPEMD
ncbi:MAG: type II toxin-antitoxin system VapC family toxin [Chloroflexi bacterium]|nr:type II toxin-antitoxin system VapC family toxin [Chloroflexota bacterium]